VRNIFHWPSIEALGVCNFSREDPKTLFLLKNAKAQVTKIWNSPEWIIQPYIWDMNLNLLTAVMIWTQQAAIIASMYAELQDLIAYAGKAHE